MSSLRTTNFLLAAIAIFLGLIALHDMIPDARAQDRRTVNLVGCYTDQKIKWWEACVATQVRVTGEGYLLTVPGSK